jgi:transcriptional regulator with XRE-family HTH domain
MANINFGERLKRARIREAMTQAELGDKVGVTQATISNWEIGKVIPSREQKDDLKRILGGFSPDAEKANADPKVDVGPNPLSGWLTKARLEKQMSVPELAEAADLSAPAIYNIESGRITNPRAETIRRLELALGQEIPSDAKEEIREEAKIEGLGELIDFDPHDDDDLPSVPGIYVLYDISERPIYVGQGSDIKRRLRSHRDKFWFKQPIVHTAAYVKIDDAPLRERVETLLIRFLKSNAVLNKQNVER